MCSAMETHMLPTGWLKTKNHSLIEFNEFSCFYQRNIFGLPPHLIGSSAFSIPSFDLPSPDLVAGFTRLDGQESFTTSKHNKTP